MSELQSFYLTVTRAHPIDGRLHPDGWVRIMAENYAAAKRLANRHFGPLWSCLYSEREFQWHREDDNAPAYPRGELAVLGCPTCSGPIRETVGMVCQTCGTDYAREVTS